jgi:hypothetical protein
MYRFGKARNISEMRLVYFEPRFISLCWLNLNQLIDTFISYDTPTMLISQTFRGGRSMLEFKKVRMLCAASIFVLASTAAAQTELSAPAAEPTAQMLMLNAGVPVTLAVTEEVNSSTHNEGDTFKLTVLNDVSAGQTVVIPKGTPATGEITWRTGKGAFGKSGKIEFALRSIELDGKSIPVTGEFRQEGEGNTVATGVGIIAVGVFAAFITGKRARLPAGRELMSQLAQPVPFTPGGQLSPSFDSEAAIAAAEAKTDLGRCKASAKALPNEKKRKSALEECYSKRME